MATKTVQITVDETLLTEVDQLVRGLGTTRSAFVCGLLKNAVRANRRTRDLEYQHAAGYAAIPQTTDEAAVWDDMRSWDES